MLSKLFLKKIIFRTFQDHVEKPIIFQDFRPVRTLYSEVNSSSTSTSAGFMPDLIFPFFINFSFHLIDSTLVLRTVPMTKIFPEDFFPVSGFVRLVRCRTKEKSDYCEPLVTPRQMDFPCADLYYN